MRLVLLSVFALLLTACGGSTAVKQNDMQLKAHPQVDSAHLWVNRKVPLEKLAAYSDIDIRPVIIKSSKANFMNVSNSELNVFREHFPAAISSRLQPPSTGQTNPEGKMTVEITVVSAKRHPPVKGALDYIPFRLLISLGKDAVNELQGIETSVFTAAIQVNAFDAKNGQFLFSIQDQLSGELFSWQGKQRSDEDLKQLADQWAERFATNFTNFRQAVLTQ